MSFELTAQQIWELLPATQRRALIEQEVRVLVRESARELVQQEMEHRIRCMIDDEAQRAVRACMQDWKRSAQGLAFKAMRNEVEAAVRQHLRGVGVSVSLTLEPTP